MIYLCACRRRAPSLSCESEAFARGDDHAKSHDGDGHVTLAAGTLASRTASAAIAGEGVAGYFSTDDNFNHAVIAQSNDNVDECWWQDGGGVGCATLVNVYAAPDRERLGLLLVVRSRPPRGRRRQQRPDLGLQLRARRRRRSSI